MTVATGGTENHLLLWDVRPQGLTGSKLEKLYDHASMTVNKNAVVGDVSAMSPGGVRLGAPALTSRGFKEDEFRQVADLLVEGAQIALRIQDKVGKPLKNFVEALPGDAAIKELKKKSEALATRFPIPGFEVDPKYKPKDH
jgi:glycine hydroxymethyltransferase